ncbi:hypothetical protein LPUS_10070 [Lasallia pustulata]|uniref:DUF7924 domain-containing protein n=1 Tax=Lasallia pustulata TaxID=136370 RepID=A0A1W5D8Z1_9LECA|nr:hypothetical protein LPUS_10070 [Lasallia pustulata]
MGSINEQSHQLLQAAVLNPGELLTPKEHLDSDRSPDRRRERSREADDPTPTVPAEPPQKRPRTELEISAIQDEPTREAASYSIIHWVQKGTWPKEYFEQDGETRQALESYGESEEIEIEDWPDPRLEQRTNMPHYLFARPKPESSLTTPSDQQSREAKAVAYRRPSYEMGLATKGSFLEESMEGITQASTKLCRTLLSTKQTLPEDSLFRDDLFKKTCRNLHTRNEEAMVIRDISLLIVPSAQTLATYGAANLDHLVESVNECWNSAITVFGPRPQPDYSVGFGRSAFTNDQLKKLAPFVGEVPDTVTSYFMATWRMYFPFLTCEVKCGAGNLEVADRQNAQSMTVAVRAVLELYKYVKREKELHGEILAFSISHDDRTVRIYGHYALIKGKETSFYRHPVHGFDFTALDGRDKWTAYTFVRNIYDKYMPILYERICSAINDLPNVDFEVSQQSELNFPEDPQLQPPQAPGGHFRTPSNAESMSLGEEDSFVGSSVTTPQTSMTQEVQRPFKSPRTHAAGSSSADQLEQART